MNSNPSIDTRLTAGVDEAGRGPLAGPVIAAAVILNEDHMIDGLADSKKLSPVKREGLAQQIHRYAIAWAIGRAEASEIDRLNILQASLLAMQRAVNALDIIPDMVLIDGLQVPEINCPCRAIVRGDASVPAISAASILAKVYRDNEMTGFEKKYPGYGFAKHKGYPTKDHILAIRKLGVTPIHRTTFAPVRTILEDMSI